MGSSQCGFFKGKPYLTSLLESHGAVAKYVDKEGPEEEVCVDFQTTLGKGPHQRLLKKLNCCGTGRKLDFFKFFFFLMNKKVVRE